MSCKKDGASTTGGGSNPSNPTNCEDPEGTITANLRNDSGYITILNGTLKMNTADNFEFTSQSYHERTFVNIGEVDGLGCVENIPESGWSNQAAVIPGNGYIVKDKYDWPNHPEDKYTKYARIYVTRYILSINNEILGAELKYQDNWKSLLNVTTTSITNITATSATCGGNVTDDGGSAVTARGVCWSTNQNPTINDSHTTNGTGTGAFTSNITGLAPYTTYYVRAYATNSNGASYGEQKSFKTFYDPDCKFSVGVNSVYFSQGNLQYQASTNTWRFAENQWDYIGDDNSATSSDGWSDLFEWGHNHTNAIVNGGGKSWRRLSNDEWEYVFNTRYTTSGVRYAKAKVNGVNGIILLPDNWRNSNYSLNSTNTSGASYSSNTISQSDWTSKLEANGAIFLPAAGYRSGTNVSNVGSRGYYWSATYPDSGYAYSVHFYDGDLVVGFWEGRTLGLSVRLVSLAE